MTITLIMLKRKQRQDLPWSIFIPKLIEMLFEPLNLPNFKKQNKTKIPGRETCSKAPRGNSGNSLIRKIKNAGNATGKTTQFKNTKKKKTDLKRGWRPGTVV